MSLIKKIAIFQILTLAVAVGIYWYLLSKYQYQSESQMLELRKNEVAASISPIYDELVSSYLLGLTDHYHGLKSSLARGKGVGDIEVVLQGAKENEKYSYIIRSTEDNAPYSVAVNDTEMIDQISDIKSHERIRSILMWCIVFVVLLSTSVLIYYIQIGRPIRRLLYAMKLDTPDEEIKQIGHQSGGEIGIIAGEVESMIKRMREMDRVEGDLSRERDMNLMHSKLAHDMRSPISVLKAYVSTIAMNKLAEQEYSDAASRSVEKLNRMADALLDYAKAKKVMREPVFIEKMYEKGVRSEINGIVSEKDSDLHSSISFTLQASIDGYKMARVVINMIQNAVKAVKDGEGRIELVAYGEDGKDLIIQVKDNGCGIDEKNLPRIFENFFSTDRKKGTGLGLAYCKQVVEAHGGTIDVESEVGGKGTTFTIRIPDCVVPESEARACHNDSRLKIDGRRFVLIDDDADIRMRWRRIVDQGGGCVVAEADSPERAWDGIDVSAADVAIVDYSFEGSQRTGVDLIAHLKRRGLKELHLCTGFADDEAIRAAAFAAGADSVIKKS